MAHPNILKGLTSGLMLLSACLPTNNLTSSTLSNSSNTTNPWATTTTPTTGDTSGIPQCLLIDASNPERAVCESCYNTVLAANCPGKLVHTDCPDPSFVLSFPSIVNQCITASIAFGATCYKTCTGGTLLNTATCSCAFPAPGSTSGSTGDIDTGVTNYGPPVISVRWPNIFNQNTDTTKLATSCSAKTSAVDFLVQNRGDTVPSMNLYSEIYRQCKVPVWDQRLDPITGAPILSGGSPIYEFVWDPVANTQLLTDATKPTYDTSSLKTYGALELQFDGKAAATGSASTDSKWLNQNMAYNDFAASPVVGPGAPFALGGGAFQVAKDPITNPNFGNYIIGTSDAAYLELRFNSTTQGYAVPFPNAADYRILSPGRYMLSFDFYALDGWVGGGFGNNSPIISTAVRDNTGTSTTLGGIIKGLPNLQPGAFLLPVDAHLVPTIAMSNRHTCAIDGTVASPAQKMWCWGQGTLGQLGDGLSTSTALPFVKSTQVDPTTLTPAKPALPWPFPAPPPTRLWAVTAGETHTCALNDWSNSVAGLNAYDPKGKLVAPGGTVTKTIYNTPLCWGDNSKGQLGIGTNANQSKPVSFSVSMNANINDFLATANVAIPVAGGSAVCADNPTSTSVNLNGDIYFTNIVSSASHTCASVGIPVTKVVQAWKWNGLGMGAACTTNGLPVSTTPTYHVVWCWGNNANGQLGDGTSTNLNAPSTVVTSAANVVFQGTAVIAAGGSHTCSGGADTKTYCWGANTRGQLGDKSTTSSPYPVEVHAVTGAAYLAAGSNHSCAKTATGVQCWGDNSFGQLGDGTTTSRTDPITTSLPFAAGGVNMLVAGYNHTCASNGLSIACWGANGNGQLGNGKFTSSPTPVEVVGLPRVPTATTTVYSLAAGGNHTCAVLLIGPLAGADYRVQCWGSNAYSELGSSSSGTHLKVGFAPYSDPVKSSDCMPNASDGTQCSTTCAQVGGVGPIVCNTSKKDIFDQTFSNIPNTSQSYGGTPTFPASQDLGGLTTTNDAAYRINVLFDHVCDMSGLDENGAPINKNCDLTLRFSGTNMDTTRSWGISHVALQRVPLCGVGYTFTDSKNQSSTYCMRFNPLQSCGYEMGLYNGTNTTVPGDVKCQCWAKPTSSVQVPFLDTLLTPTEALYKCPGAPVIPQ